MAKTTRNTPQLHSSMIEERIPLPDSGSMTTEQLEIAESLTRGPRKGVVGPYIALMQSPRLLNLIEPLGTALRFHGSLDHRVRELVICAVARHTSNQFEWTAHAPLAVKAGVSSSTISAVLEGRCPKGIPEDEFLALEFSRSLMCVNGVSDSLFEDAKVKFGDEGIIELTTLVGYFVTVCWIMNVARTQSREEPEFGILRPFV